MTSCYVALTTLSDQVRMDELAVVAGALQTQVNRDFAPEWNIGATIAAVSFESIPAGYIPLIVQDTLDTDGANGYHRTRGDDTPYILIPRGPRWPLAASHELLRMLANPTGSGRVPALSTMPGQAVVEYILDVCAPCQDVTAAYAIDGVPVSDFARRSFLAIRDSGSVSPARRTPRLPPGRMASSPGWRMTGCCIRREPIKKIESACMAGSQPPIARDCFCEN